MNDRPDGSVFDTVGALSADWRALRSVITNTGSPNKIEQCSHVTDYPTPHQFRWRFRKVGVVSSLAKYTCEPMVLGSAHGEAQQ